MFDVIPTVCAVLVIAALFVGVYRLTTAQMSSPVVVLDVSPADEAREAARSGDLAALMRLLDSHGAAAVRADYSPDDLTSLHWAAAAGCRDVVEFLLSDDVHADPRATRCNNFTPLHSAAMEGHSSICKLLLDAGADPNVQTDPQGYTPMHSASWGGHVDTVQMLLAHGANEELRNYRDETAIETARRHA